MTIARFDLDAPLVDDDGKPTMFFHVFMDFFARELENTIDTAIAAALTANWSGVIDDDGHRPEDDATLGADLATNVSNNNLDNLTDGATYGRALLSRLNAGKPWIDFGEAIHSNKILDNIGDGSTYGRALLSRLNAGKPLIDFAEGIHSNKILDNIGDGTTYGRPLLTRLNAGKPLIDFAEGIHSNKSLANVDAAQNTKLVGIAERAGTALTIYDVNPGLAYHTITGNSIQKIAGNGFYHNLYSEESYLGTAHVQGKMTTDRNFIGLSKDRETTATNAYLTIDYALYSAYGTLYVFENGGSENLLLSHVSTDVLSIVYDGVNVRYYQNGTLIRTTAATEDIRYYAAFSLTDVNAVISNITFGPYSRNNWGSIGGANRPENNATLGANWASNLTNRPTELTDGRVAAGLDSAGDLARNLTSARADSSNILRRTAGGLYSGNLDATKNAIGGNLLYDDRFGEGWSLNTGAIQVAKGATNGFAIGRMPYALQITVATGQIGAGSIGDGIVPVTANKDYYFSTYVQSNTTANSTAYCYIRWLDSAGAQISDHVFINETTVGVPTGQPPKLFTQKFTAPSNAVSVFMIITVLGTGSPTGAWRFEKPSIVAFEEGATLGAAWASNLTGRPTELTDGRVSAGLDASGDLARNITSARADSSNVLRKTGGGLYTGALDATLGANWDSNVTNKPSINEIFDPINYATTAAFEAQWVISGTGELAIVNTSDTGGTAVQLGNNSGNDPVNAYMNDANFMPYDGTSLYEVWFDVEFTAYTSGVFYAGVAAQDRAGNNLGGTYNYVAALAATPTIGRKVWRGYLKGHGAHGSSPFSDTINAPSTLPDGSASGFGQGGAVRMKPIALFHYGPGTGTAILHGAGMRKVSQGDSLARLSSVDLATTQITNKNTTNLTDGAKFGSTGILIDPPNDVIIYADVYGVVKSGQLPRQILLKASFGTSDITTSGTWSRTVTDGVTCTIGAATGVFEITALTVNEVHVPLEFTYNGIVRPMLAHIVRQDDPPTNPGGSGTSANTATLGNTTGTSYDLTNAITPTLTVKPSGAGKVTCTATLSYKRTPGTSNGVTGSYGKWQWRVPAGSWADVDTEVASTYNAQTSGAPTFPYNTSGSISVVQTKTSLTAGADYEFRFAWRRTDVSGDADDVYLVSGRPTADGTVP